LVAGEYGGFEDFGVMKKIGLQDFGLKISKIEIPRTE
jgi:hypothetical protein